MDKAYIDAKSHGWSSAPIVEMLIPSTMDNTLAPRGPACCIPILPAILSYSSRWKLMA
jgi:phytoene dehydrogenase-like protein